MLERCGHDATGAPSGSGLGHVLDESASGVEEVLQIHVNLNVPRLRWLGVSDGAAL